MGGRLAGWLAGWLVGLAWKAEEGVECGLLPVSCPANLCSMRCHSLIPGPGRSPRSFGPAPPPPFVQRHAHPRPPPLSRAQAGPETEQERQLKEEQELMRAITQKQALKTYAELAKDISYTQSMNTGWKPPLKIRRMSAAEHQAVRDQFHIICEGAHVPPGGWVRPPARHCGA